MRLIDADALIAKAYIMQEPNGFIHSVVTERQIVKAPTIDAVPVVRCGECKHTREKTAYEAVYLKPECLICEHPEVSEDGWTVVSPEHFCSYGDRKDGDGR